MDYFSGGFAYNRPLLSSLTCISLPRDTVSRYLSYVLPPRFVFRNAAAASDDGSEKYGGYAESESSPVESDR